MRHTLKFAGLLLAVAALVGCNTMPIQNVSNAPVMSATGKNLSNQEVRDAIVRAGGALGWKMKDERANMLVGTLQLRDHVAVIEIPYTTSAYTIRYRTSVNLDEKDGMIHKNYNGWILNLTRGINAQLSAS